MELSQVEELARRLTQLATARDLSVSFLAGGITNQNYRIQAGRESYVIRVPGSNTGLLGIDRTNEAHNHCIAASAGIAPDAIGYIMPEGCLVTRFIDGDKIPPEEMRSEGGIHAICHSLHVIHDGPSFLGTFSPFRTLENYLLIARQRGQEVTSDIALALRLAGEIERAILEGGPLTPRPIHSDLLNENFISERGSIRILDWEYSGMGDVMFDLANLAEHHGFEEQEEKALLLEYYGRANGGDVARLRLMRIMSDIREAMWGVVQSSISTIDFDFAGYAKDFFSRMAHLATDARYQDWLEAAASSE